MRPALRALWAVLIGLILTVSQQALAAEITVWHSYGGNEEQGLTQAAETWTQQSGVTVRLVAIPFGAFTSKIETAIPRGNGPDVFIAGHDNLGKWTAFDLVEPTTQVSVPGIRADLMEAVTWEGQTYGIPLAYKSLVLLYNPELVHEVPQTTDQLIAVAHELTGEDRYGLAYQAAEPYFHAAWAHAFGASIYDDQGQIIPFDDPRHVSAFAFTERIAKDEEIVPKQPTYELVQRLYDEGKVGFVINGPWFVADVSAPIQAAPLPVVSEAGQPARPYLTVDGGFLATQAKNPEAGLQFITWLAGAEGARIRQDVGQQAVANTSVTTDDPLLEVLAQQSRTSLIMPKNPDQGGAFEAQATALRQILRGASTPEKAGKAAAMYYDVVSRPAPPAANPWPYLAIMGAVGIFLAFWVLSPLRQPDLRQKVRKHAWDYAWIAPAGIASLLLVVTPFITGAGVAFFSHEAGEYTFVGLQNFIDILFARDWPLSSPLSFYYTLFVTIAWTITNLVVHVGLGIALALLLREPWVKMRGWWRALLILPWAVPNYITALIWKSMFHVQYGAINSLITLGLGADQPVQVDWFGSFFTAFGANLTTNGWLGFPFMMVITLGALQSIPRELEEAAEVDGASWWFRFRNVIWPLLKPALLPAVILGSVWTFNAFNIIYLVSAGEPDGSTEILISEAYRWAFTRGNRYGYAAAYAILIFGVLLVYSRGANKLAGRKVL